jgi:hypothetical protein
MNLFTELEGFDWDEGNLKKNWEKHQVTFLECEQVFFNRPFVVAEDEPHSRAEARYYVLGTTDTGRLLFIVFTVRNNRIRVVSARDMSKKERGRYYEEIKKDTEI